MRDTGVPGDTVSASPGSSGSTGSGSGPSTARMAQSSTQSMVAVVNCNGNSNAVGDDATRTAGSTCSTSSGATNAWAPGSGATMPHRRGSSPSTQCLAVSTYARNPPPDGVSWMTVAEQVTGMAVFRSTMRTTPEGTCGPGTIVVWSHADDGRTQPPASKTVSGTRDRFTSTPGSGLYGRSATPTPLALVRTISGHGADLGTLDPCREFQARLDTLIFGRGRPPSAACPRRVSDATSQLSGTPPRLTQRLASSRLRSAAIRARRLLFRTSPSTIASGWWPRHSEGADDGWSQERSPQGPAR